MTATTKQATTNASSQRVVATEVKRLLELQNHSTLVLNTGGRENSRKSFIETITGRRLSNKLASSLMPRRVKLDKPATLEFVVGLEESLDARAKAIREKEVKSPEIPTAELVTRGSFKTGAKLLIKIVPSTSTSALPEELVIDNFSLQGIAEPDEERYQIHETFESEVLFLFGRRPRVWTMQGIILNGNRPPDLTDEELAQLPFNNSIARQSESMDFANELIEKWNDSLRGSKAIESRSKTYISYEETVIEGTLLSMTLVRNSQMPSAVNATITFIVHSRTTLNSNILQEAQNLQEAVEAAKVATKKVQPTKLKKKKAGKKEIKRREKKARDEEGTARENAETLNKERNDLIEYVGEKERDLEGIETANQINNENREFALQDFDAAVASGDTEAQDEALRTIEASLRTEDSLVAAEIIATSDKQAAENRLGQVEESLNEFVSVQEDASVKTEVLTGTSDAVFDDPAVIEDGDAISVAS